MADSEKFSLFTWIFGNEKTDWWRSTGDFARLVIIGLAIVGIFISVGWVKNTFFPKKEPAQTTQIQGENNKVENTGSKQFKLGVLNW